MRFFRIILLLVLATALFLVFRYVVPRKLETEKSPVTKKTETVSAKDESKLLLGSREEVENFAFMRKGVYLKMKKVKDGWDLVSPVEGSVRGEYLQRLFKTLHETVLVNPFLSLGKNYLNLVWSHQSIK